MKFKVIDLLVKIANGEEVPEKIKIGNSPFELILSGKHYSGNTDSVLNNVIGMEKLNDYVEIIEEDKKIEKMECSVESWFTPSQADIEIIKKVNELIDEVNKLKEGK